MKEEEGQKKTKTEWKKPTLMKGSIHETYYNNSVMEDGIGLGPSQMGQ